MAQLDVGAGQDLLHQADAVHLVVQDFVYRHRGRTKEQGFQDQGSGIGLLTLVDELEHGQGSQFVCAETRQVRNQTRHEDAVPAWDAGRV